MQSDFYFYSTNARHEMLEVIQSMPSDIEVYLVGGAIRNALIRKYHGETWLQRDYDQIVTKKSASYLNFLHDRGFRSVDSANRHVISKPVVKNGQEVSYEDNIVFDIHMADGTTAEDNLRYGSGLLINGFALPLREIFSHDWETKLIRIPGALESIKSKQVKINPDGYSSEANYFFACMRFIGAGFAAPPEDEVVKLLVELPKLEHDRYQRNLVKLSKYVGGEAKARQIIASVIGSEIDIFDESSAKNAIVAKYGL